MSANFNTILSQAITKGVGKHIVFTKGEPGLQSKPSTNFLGRIWTVLLKITGRETKKNDASAKQVAEYAKKQIFNPTKTTQDRNDIKVTIINLIDFKARLSSKGKLSEEGSIPLQEAIDKGVEVLATKTAAYVSQSNLNTSEIKAILEDLLDFKNTTSRKNGLSPQGAVDLKKASEKGFKALISKISDDITFTTREEVQQAKIDLLHFKSCLSDQAELSGGLSAQEKSYLQKAIALLEKEENFLEKGSIVGDFSLKVYDELEPNTALNMYDPKKYSSLKNILLSLIELSGNTKASNLLNRWLAGEPVNINELAKAINTITDEENFDCGSMEAPISAQESYIDIEVENDGEAEEDVFFDCVSFLQTPEQEEVHAETDEAEEDTFVEVRSEEFIAASKELSNLESAFRKNSHYSENLFPSISRINTLINKEVMRPEVIFWWEGEAEAPEKKPIVKFDL